MRYNCNSKTERIIRWLRVGLDIYVNCSKDVSKKGVVMAGNTYSLTIFLMKGNQYVRQAKAHTLKKGQLQTFTVYNCPYTIYYSCWVISISKYFVFIFTSCRLSFKHLCKMVITPIMIKADKTNAKTTPKIASIRSTTFQKIVTG